MDWPILVDSLNLLAIDVVPLTLLIDESGIIRKIRPRQEDLEEFLATNYPVPPKQSAVFVRPRRRLWKRSTGFFSGRETTSWIG